MTGFRIVPRGPFSLAASTEFLEGFTPAGYEGAEAGHLHLAFPVDGAEAAVGVCLRQPGEAVTAELYGETGGQGLPDAAAVRAQVERILSLDVDGAGFPDVGRRDPVVSRLQARWPGLRPVCFFSPYEAAAWTLIGHRSRIVQAARVKEAIARELGAELDIHGDRRHAFPGAARLAALDGFPGLDGRKLERLRALGAAAGAGGLDAAPLRSLPHEQALARLRELSGIGPFSAELILVRGAGEPDFFPGNEPRARRAVALAYGLDREPDDDWLAERTSAWRPYRSWVTLLLRANLEAETHEIAGGSGPGRSR